MKKPYVERVVTADGYGPLLFFLMTAVAFFVAAYFMHFLLMFGANIRL